MSGASMKSELRIKSARKEIRAAREFACEQLGYLGIDEKLKENIVFCVTEAVTNGILHGNGEDPEKYVIISIECSGGKIVIDVTDCGAGFDINAIPDPTSEKNLSNDSGRGLFFIKNMMSSVSNSSSETGATLTMIKHL